MCFKGLVEMKFYNTIDLDSNDKEYVDRVIKKIESQHCCLKMTARPSSKKGYHVMMVCKYPCQVCRVVFDDQTRFFYDQFRPPCSRNVLFDSYERVELTDSKQKPMGKTSMPFDTKKVRGTS